MYLGIRCSLVEKDSFRVECCRAIDKRVGRCRKLESASQIFKFGQHLRIHAKPDGCVESAQTVHRVVLHNDHRQILWK